MRAVTVLGVGVGVLLDVRVDTGVHWKTVLKAVVVKIVTGVEEAVVVMSEVTVATGLVAGAEEETLDPSVSSLPPMMP